MSQAAAPPAGAPAALAIVGVARNCAGTIEATLARLEAAVPRGVALHWCIVESDSSDDSAARLQRWAGGRERAAAISLGALRERLPSRTARIAHCRNACLDWLRAQVAHAPIEQVLVADLDGVVDRLDASGLASCWARGDWDACTANVEGPYYDLWALRHPHWCPGDCWAEADALAALGAGPERARLAAVYARMLRISPEAPWIEVDSAFGGLALYRSAPLLEARYDGLAADGREVCEHVTLHARMRAAGARLWINPRLLATSAAALAEHLPPWHRLAGALERPAVRGALRLTLGAPAARQLRQLVRTLT
jgi:hypothetical protein